MGTELRICGICLKICDTFKVIGKDMKDILDTVLPKLDLIITIREPVMCSNCKEMLKKCFDFKTACLHTYGYIVPFVNNKDSVKLDLKEIYLRTNENGTGVSEDQDVCGLCMCTVKNCFAICLDVGEGDLIFTKMMKQCLPELDLSIIRKPVICPSCRGSLEHCFHSVTTCLLAEEKIKKYRENLEINSNVQIELSSLLQFIMKDEIKGEVDDNAVEKIMAEEQFCEKTENADGRRIDNKNDTFKLEQMLCEEINIEMKEPKFLVKEEIEVKTDYQDFNRDASTSSKSIMENINIYDPNKCWGPDQALFEGEMKNSENLAELNTVYNCQSCPFVAKRRASLKTYMLIHGELSEVTVYTCENSPFATKHKRSLKKHLLTHREVSEIIVYRCERCSYVTKFKGNLETHMLTHPVVSEATVYQCKSCSYVAKRKWNLKSHMLTHRDVLEGIVYRCKSCSYVAKRKTNLKTHMLTHRKLSEVTVFTCERCPFVTKHKRSLKRHMLTHRVLSEVTGYKCQNCSYVAIRKRNLKTHMLTHLKLSEVTIYTCETCPFLTKHKRSLKRHMWTHQEYSELIVYKCECCSYLANREGDLKSHVDPSRSSRSQNIQMQELFICSKTNRGFIFTHVDPPRSFRSKIPHV